MTNPLASQIGPYAVVAHIREADHGTLLQVVFSRPARFAPMFVSEVVLRADQVDGSAAELEKLDQGRFLPEVSRGDVIDATATFLLKGDPTELSGEVTVRCDHGKKAMSLVHIFD